MAAPIRTAKKLLLGAEIAHMIATAGVSHQAAASIIEASQAKMTGLIAGTGAITFGDLKELASRLGFDDPDYQAQLQELRRDSHKRGYWGTGFRRAYTDDFRLMVDLEWHASSWRGFDVEIWPGMLQCESFIRSVIASDIELGEGDKKVDPGIIEDRVRARLHRQEAITGPKALELHVVMSESCIEAEYAPPAVMAEQARHAIEMSKLDNVTVQIVPFKGRRRFRANGKFVLLEVPSPGAAGPLKIAYVENAGETRYLDDDKALPNYERTWKGLADTALDPDPSREMLLAAEKRFRDAA